jgi:hypothetical protein
MKILLFVVFLILLGLVLLNRQRVYLRDPLATVYKSTAQDGSGAVKQAGVQVYINYSNDVLLLHEAQAGGYSLLVQHWNKTPGTPVELKCIHWMACLANADQADLLPVQAGPTFDPKVQMTDREVSFLDPRGAWTRVTLR